jgi:uncharacterized protein (TIGR02246 family)
MHRVRPIRAAAAAALVMVAACARTPRPEGAAPAADAGAARAGVLALLAHGAGAWNRGDLAGFVSDYDSGASFVTPRRVLHGRAEIQAHYAPRFAPGGVRDSLWFQDVEVDRLAPDALNAIAYYVLQRGDSVTARGPTSLVMRFRGGRWLIVHDHSS